MNSSKYDQDYEYDDYDSYADPQVTGVGLPPGQMALIIGVNAVISLIIAVAVVLIANRQVAPGELAAAPTPITPAATVGGQANPPPAGGVPAESSPAEPPTLEPTPLESVTYAVQPGDTLGQIAQKFDVSLFDLMVANGLSDQDFIQVGQVLDIPLGGLPDVTPTFTPAPVFTDTPLPFDPPTPLPDDATRPAEPAVTVGPSATPSPTVPITPTEGIVLEPTPIPTSTPAAAGDISVTISNVVGAGNLAQETVIILNQGPGVSLQDWRLEGSSLGNFVFPDLFLFSGGSIRIHTAAGQNSPSDLYLGQGEAAWLPGGSVKLVNAAGDEVSRFDVPAQ